MRAWLCICLFALIGFSTQAHARARLLTVTDGVVAFSGPGEFYRPLQVLPARTELKSANKPVQTKDGAFYKVVVRLSEKQSVIGYISIASDIRFIDDSMSTEDLGEDMTKYGDVALVNKAIQISFTNFRDRRTLATLGYMKYLSPGFYVKGFGGQFSDPSATAIAAGGEVGNDALLIGRVSGLVSYALGVFAPSEAGRIFEASSRVNAMMQAAIGARYNFSGVASMSVAATQAVFFNANNSLVTSGATLTLEVGL